MAKFNSKTIKTFTFNDFCRPDGQKEDYQTKAISYNFFLDKQSFSSGYGVEVMKMPTDKNDLNNQTPLDMVGSQVLRMWSFPWFNDWENEIKYKLFYFNDQKQFVNMTIIGSRELDSPLSSNFTSVPVGMNYRIHGHDYMIFSAADGDTYALGETYQKVLENAPKLMDICSHDDKLYALTATGRRTLVYSESNNIFDWDNSTTAHLDFTDERGQMTKVLSFNDYLYVFREFGITRVSTYANGEFNISHIFQSTSYIFPETISSSGEEIYFLTREGFYRFDGSTVKKLDLDLAKNIQDLTHASASVFEGKYYLACRLDFKDAATVGCEEGEYINNAIIIYDIGSGEVEVMRGVDAAQLLALNNPYVSKLAISFNGEHIGKIGQLSSDGKIFGSSIRKYWSSKFSYFGMGRGMKRVESFSFNFEGKFTLKIESDIDAKEFTFEGTGTKRVRVKLSGHKFKLSFASDDDVKINDFQISISAQSEARQL